MEKIKIAIIGATGLVGRTFIKILEEEQDNSFDIKLFASYKSVGKKIKIGKKYYIVNELNEKSFINIDYALFFTNDSVSSYYVPLALSNNVKVIDNSSSFRNKDDVKLITYGVNESLITKEDQLISNPNCAVMQCMPLINTLKNYDIDFISYNTYQSVSGSGKKGIDDLLRCRKGLVPLFYETDISFTCIPKIGEYSDNDFTSEEIKMQTESKKILSLDNVKIVSTCVRVPTMCSHGVSVLIRLNKEFETSQVKKQFKELDNVVVCEKILPTGVLSCNNDNIYVGRIRKYNSYLLFYCVADNVRVGAATNVYKILKHMIRLGESY